MVSTRTARRLIIIGAMSAAAPITSRTLAILEPMTLPTDKPGKPEILALIEVNNSGAEVPKAMTVAAMNTLEIP